LGRFVREDGRPARSRLAVHAQQRGTDIRTVQKLLRHSDVRTTMIYTHVLERAGWACATVG